MDCLFCKFATQTIPKDFIYEDEDIMVFPDIHPIKPTHLLIVPKRHIHAFEDLEDDMLLGKIRKVIQDMAKKHGLQGKGYRIIINAGGAQGIDHLHIHLTGPWGLKADW